jgi:hypothetical protein
MTPAELDQARTIASAQNSGIGWGFNPDMHRMFCALVAEVDAMRAEVQAIPTPDLARGQRG